jgi:hypothetical protein
MPFLHFMFHCDVTFERQEYCDKLTRLVCLMEAFEHHHIVILGKYVSLLFLHVKHADFLLGLLFDPEDRGDMFLGNVG